MALSQANKDDSFPVYPPDHENPSGWNFFNFLLQHSLTSESIIPTLRFSAVAPGIASLYSKAPEPALLVVNETNPIIRQA